MTLTEKIAYIRGLAEGLNLDENKAEVKVLNAIMEILDDMAETVTDLGDLYDEMADVVDEIDEDLSILEEDVYDDCCDCDCDDDCDCGCCDHDDCDSDCVYYEVVCPTCNKEINVEEDILLEGEITCPSCGENLEFDFSELDCSCCDCEDEE